MDGVPVLGLRLEAECIKFQILFSSRLLNWLALLDWLPSNWLLGDWLTLLDWLACWPQDGLALDRLALDGLALDWLALDGLALDGLTLDGLALVLLGLLLQLLLLLGVSRLAWGGTGGDNTPLQVPSKPNIIITFSVVFLSLWIINKITTFNYYL